MSFDQWTCQKDLKKARQIEHQKLQRKERKEKKDIDKFSNHIMQLENRLSELRRSDKLMDNHGAVMEFERMPQDNIIFGRDSIEKKTDIRTEQSDDPSANIVSVENDESGNDRILPDEMPAPNISKNAENLAEKGHESSVKGKQTNYLLCPSATNTSKLDANETSPLTLGEGMSSVNFCCCWSSKLELTIFLFSKVRFFQSLRKPRPAFVCHRGV